MSFGPATPRVLSSQQSGNLTTVCHCLMFEEDDKSLLGRDTLHTRMEHHSPEEPPMAHHLTSIEEEGQEEEDAEEHFQTVFTECWCLDGRTHSRQALMHSWTFTTWPVPYPCPYSLNQLHLAPDYAAQYMDQQWHFWPPLCNNNCQWWGYF